MSGPQSGKCTHTVALCAECLMQFSGSSWRWLLLSALCVRGCRGLPWWLRGSPKVTSLNLIPGLSVATDQALRMMLCCLLTESLLVKDEGSLPWLELLCVVSLNRALFSLCLFVWIKQRRWVVGAGTFWLFKGDLPPTSYCHLPGKWAKGQKGAFSPKHGPGISWHKSQASW